MQPLFDNLSKFSYNPNRCGCSSAVERQLPKLNVTGSSPVTRSLSETASSFKKGTLFCCLLGLLRGSCATRFQIGRNCLPFGRCLSE